MKVLLTLVLALCWLKLFAQGPPAPTVDYTNASARYRLTYPRAWHRHVDEDRPEVMFYAGETWRNAPATVTVLYRPLPESQKNLTKLLSRGQLDSVERSILRLPRAQVLGLSQRDAGAYEEIRYDYSYDLGGSARIHIIGRRLWRAGYEYQIEYRAAVSQDRRYRRPGEQLLESFTLTGNPVSRRYADQQCDNKMYGIAALRFDNDRWEDDCRTIHEFSTSDLTDEPIVHRRVLPFQSYALTKGFDNCLYSVTKSPTDAPEYVYRYDPAIRKGRYTRWQLPAQGPENVWISAATDEQGDLFFLTSDANMLVKVSPQTDSVTVVWSTDPMRQAPYYPTIGFPGAGSHGNFCLDDGTTLYQVYSSDGALLRVDLTTGKPAPELTPLTGLPRKGGYSDLLFQNDAQGRRRLYLAGPKAMYQVDMARRQARRVRGGTYTDLAGCNLFRVMTRPAPAPPPPNTAQWKGRVLDAITFQPLPQARLQLGDTPVTLSPDGSFSVPAEPGRSYAARVQLGGYLAADSTITPAPGPYVRDILLQPLAVGTTMPLNNVQFEQGRAALLPSSYPALNQLVALLAGNPGISIELRGHTDNVGDPQKNVVLSQQRVSAVKAYLVSRGIAESRITGVGLGGAQPSASNVREATRRLNRRVEFRVTGVQ
ncbi:OmpA family protein [Hymenobacter sp. BT175]|uniref:OmpA family protein n=1 Tax=Hymenobacter translucens TaxID=2886507 RepID=UPI001D0DF813|nr:OmpA family protein [Hymenobacter translucens]MCC2546613.1 OmpA family protein [Hymenobacter translucens]